MARLNPCALFVGVLLAGCATAPPQVSIECFHGNAATEADIGFCRAVRAGNTLYISGAVGQGEMPEAMRRAYGVLRKTLEDRGLGFRHVVKETVFATDLDAFVRAKDVRKEFYGSHLPAASWVQVSRLFRPALVVEVELIAVYPQ